MTRPRATQIRVAVGRLQHIAILRHWEFWAAIVLATALRLWQLRNSQFFDDQAELMTLARQAVLYRAIPVTGIRSSIGTLNPPLSIYVLLPFALITRDPFPSLLTLALWNVLGVALFYLFALHYGGRKTAAIAALLFACTVAPISYSRFLWQQNYLPTLLVIWALSWQAAIRSERRMPWLVVNVVALLAAILLHPTATLLTPITVFTPLLSRNRPSRRDYAISGALVGALALPTLVWEFVSGGSDIPTLVRFLAAPKKLDPEVLYRLYTVLAAPIDQLRPVKLGSGPLNQLSQLISTPTNAIFTADSAYARLGPLWVALACILFALSMLGWIVLTRHVAAPIIALARATSPSSNDEWKEWLSMRWDDLRGCQKWPEQLLLWLWVTLPLVLLLRHTGPVRPHYLLVLYPGMFLVMAQGTMWAVTAAMLWRQVLGHNVQMRATGAVISSVLFVALLGGELLQSSAVFDGLARGQFNATASQFGYLLSDMQAADGQITHMVQATGASTSTILLDPTYAHPLSYLLIGEHPGRIGVADACLVLPAPSRRPALIVATRPTSRAARLLASLPNATLAGTIAMRGGTPFLAYTYKGTLPRLLVGERGAGGITFGAATQPDARLDAVSVAAPGVLRFRWEVLHTTAIGQLPTQFRLRLSWRSANQSFTAPVSFSDCTPSRWQAGATAFTWLTLPRNPTPTLMLELQHRGVAPAIHMLGPIPLLSQATGDPPFDTIPPVAVPGVPLFGSISPQGIVVTKAMLVALGALTGP